MDTRAFSPPRRAAGFARYRPLLPLALVLVAALALTAGCGRAAKAPGVSTTRTAAASTTQSTASPTTKATVAPTTNATPPSTATTTTEADPAVVEEKLGLHATDATGEKPFVAMLVDFPDVEREYTEKALLDRMTDLIPRYFKDASYGKFILKPDSAGPFTLPQGVSAYRISPANLEVDESRVLSLITTAFKAADADVDFSKYEFVTMHLGANTQDYGMVGYCAIPGMLGYETMSVTLGSGEVINKAAVYCENAHLGTYIHDMLHMIGGMAGAQRLTPCLYDNDLQAKYTSEADAPKCLINMGFWDPLSSHYPYDRDLPPAGLSSWTKLRLGWIDPEKIALVKKGETATVDLGPLADGDSRTLVIRIPLTPTTYYLIENRQPVSSDVNLPTSGVLVLLCDDEVLESRHGKAPARIVDANPSVPYMNDATFDIGKKDTFIDEENNLAVILEKKDGLTYRIKVTTADQAGATPE